MKYLTYLISLLLVLAFVGCDKAKDTATDIKKTKTEAIEEAMETVDETTGEATEAVEEHKCGEGKCGEGKCGGDEAKETVKEVTE